jgi:transketolase
LPIPTTFDAIIRRGVVSDAAGLAAFAARTFTEASGDDTGADDLEAHLAATYRADLQARELGGRYAWLGVRERNARAMAFYRKAGFDEIGCTHYVVGSDRQVDRVYLASLSPQNSVAAVRSHDHDLTEQT